MKIINTTFAFIDAENVRNAVETAGFVDLDYQLIFEWLKTKKGVSRIFLYVGAEPNDTEKLSYFEALGKIEGCQIRVKSVISHKPKIWTLDCECPKCYHNFKRRISNKGKKKANCDTDLTLDVVRCGVKKKYKNIIVFSGDGDFVPVYEYVSRNLKKGITVYAPSDLNGIKRTSLAIKELNRQKTIRLENLFGLLPKYGLSEYKIK